jgi:hypothetical protein
MLNWEKKNMTIIGPRFIRVAPATQSQSICAPASICAARYHSQGLHLFFFLYIIEQPLIDASSQTSLNCVSFTSNPTIVPASLNSIYDVTNLPIRFYY